MGGILQFNDNTYKIANSNVNRHLKCKNLFRKTRQMQLYQKSGTDDNNAQKFCSNI